LKGEKMQNPDGIERIDMPLGALAPTAEETEGTLDESPCQVPDGCYFCQHKKPAEPDDEE
jgi:hypothetical protein